MRLIALLLLSGCGTSTEVEPQLTITQGLYGQLTESCTQKDCIGAPRKGTPVGWFDRSPFVTDGGVAPVPLQTMTTTETGLFQFPIPSNERGYLAIGRPEASIGTRWFSATSALIPLGLARIDWHASPANEGVWTNVK